MIFACFGRLQLNKSVTRLGLESYLAMRLTEAGRYVQKKFAKR
jgi:hypothetical protein